MNTQPAVIGDPYAASHVLREADLEALGGKNADMLAKTRDAVLESNAMAVHTNPMCAENARWLLLQHARTIGGTHVGFYLCLHHRARQVGHAKAPLATGIVRVAARIAAYWTANVLRGGPGPRANIAPDYDTDRFTLSDLIIDAADVWWSNRSDIRPGAEVRLRRALVLHTPPDPTMRRILDDMLRKTRPVGRSAFAAEGYFLRTAATAAARDDYHPSHLGHAARTIMLDQP